MPRDLFALRQAVLEDLEPRILFSADNPAGLLAATLTDPNAPAEQHATVDASAAQQAAAAHELVFIDARAPDADALFANIAAQAAAGRPIEAFWLHADADGIAQVSAVLADRDNVTAIHLIGHGDDGAMRLGGSWLDADMLLTRAGDIAAWGGHLSADADLLLYGCDFAAEPAGRALVADLAQLTGADVAASTDATGATALGGDWALEATTGTIDSSVAIDAAGRASYANLLNTYIVTTTANSGPGSLRQAITDANANAGTDTISFNIAGTGVHTISLSTALPAITGTVILDASTDDSFAANGSKPAIVLDGGNGNFAGLQLASTADGSTIRGLVVQGFQTYGIRIDAGSDGHIIVGNYIGELNASGTVGGNGNGTGLSVLGANSLIGGTTAADRNVIAGNYNGLEFTGTGATGNQVVGNYVGVDATGQTTLGNTYLGIAVLNGASGNTFGGSNTNQRNVIAGNVGDAVYISGETSDNNIVRGNWIGISADGSTLLRNGGDGVYIVGGADNTQVGGSGANDGNWIAGVTFRGVEIDGASTGTVIQGNRIGTDLAGTANWGPNQNGILLSGGASTSTITGNTIAFSGQNNTAGYTAGVLLSNTAGTANQLSANTIYSSVGIGIDLNGNGVTANDAGDGDTGANNLQNFPVLTLARTNASSQVTVSGTLNGTANSYFRIEFFASASADATGYGEGQTYLGFANVATNGSGNATISATLSGVNVPVGYVISATATASNVTYTTFTDTSEFSLAVTTTALVDTIAVDTTADTLDGDTSSLTALLANKGADGFISLREAITAANNTANGAQPDRINFNIAGTGVHTITVSSALPSITGAVILDASTDDSFVANGGKPAIILDGGNGNFDGLQLTSSADGSTIRGLVIRNFRGDGIQINAGSDGNTIAGNYIGRLGASGTVGGTGNNGDAILVYGANNVIGGTTAADRNVVAGNNFGIELYGASATGNQIVGNYIGTDATGLATLGNTSRGVGIFAGATGNTVGGSSTNQRNLIAGNGNDAVNIDGEASDNNIVRGNWIGVGADGSTLLGNGGDGIYVSNGADNTQIGGAGANDGNWIAGAALIGIELDGASTGTVVQGNRIGTDLAGTANWGTGQTGILLENGVGTSSLLGNTIAFAGQSNVAGFATGVRISDSAGTANQLSANSIYSNVGIGIDLRGDGVTANDSGDADSGANNLQNYPVLSLARTDASNQLDVSGTLNSNANSYFRIEFFASPSADSTGQGEGQIYLGFANVATNGSGNATISATLSGVNVPVGYLISATATKSDASYTTFTDTSEFAKNVAAIPTTQATLTVDTASDTSDGDTTSLSTLIANKGADGFISLREAITAANNTANGTSGADRIVFQIAGTGVHTINPATSLPSITDAVILDATTDDSFAANGSRPAIVLDGNNLGGDGLTLTSTADGSTIRGFVIRDFGTAGIHIDAGSDGHTIAGNYLGRLNTSGTDAGAGEGNGTRGLYIAGANNLIGGTSAADRNVISGNTAIGIVLDGAAATGNVIAGNYIGLTAAGTVALGNAEDGIQLIGGASGNTVGGATSAHRNVISGNSDGIQIGHITGGSNSNVIQNNYIGTDATGLVDLGNTSDGVDLWYSSSNNQILDNVVSGNNGNGLYIGNTVGTNTGTVIRGNLIGLGADGSTALGNSGDGINIGDGAVASNTVVGGNTAGQGNTIAYNTRGIWVVTSTGSSILGNVVYGNTGLGIDLGTSGVTANDTGDADSGANNLQNFPVLTVAKTNGSSQIDIRGTLNSTANSYYRLEFFAQPANGSSATLLGFVNVATDGSGNASFSNTFAAAVPVGYTITATATKSNAGYSAYTDTSEFAVTLDAGTTPVNTVPGAKTVIEDVAGALTGLAVVNGGVLAMTTSLSVLNGALTVSLAGGATISSGANSSGSLTLSGTTAQVNAALATLSYLGHTNYSGSDTLTMLSTDASALSDSDTVAITVTAVNDAPVLTPAAPTLSALTEDQTGNAGQTVASFIGASITDVDSGAVQGIAITSLTSGTGTWEFSTNGGSSWAAIGGVSGSSALLLRSTDSIRFVPNGQSATSGSIAYRAWDQTSGTAGSQVDASTNGGATAFSTSTDTASITVTAVNDAPVLGAIAPTLTTISEDATANGGQTVASLIGASITDVDAGAVQGIAITSLTSGTGTWQYSTNGGSSWTGIGTVSGTSALLLRSTDAVRFVPDGQNATTGSITYRAWDQSGGSTGSKVDASTNGSTTAFSTSTDTASITVTAVNDAPVLGAIAPTLTSITEDQTTSAGQTVASLVGASITDVDSGAVLGIAVTGLISGTGTWEFSTNGGSSWGTVGAVSGSSALLLRSTDSVRFVPDGQNATSGSITYRAWDQTSGTTGSRVDVSTSGGTTAFSTATDTASVTVTAANDAPVLGAIAPALTSITEDQITNAGQTVASFVGASITDVDTSAVQGIAVTGLASGTGTWEFSTDGGSNWSAVGPVSGSSALLLRSTDSVRFVPNGQNATSGSIAYRAWDQTSGAAGSKVDASTTGGTTAFSTSTDSASITVTAVNDAPVLSAIAPTLTSILEDQTGNAGQTVASFIGASITDVDTGAVQGIAVTGLTSGTGTWEFSIDAGSSWSAVGAVSGSSALLLRSTDSVRFVPSGDNATTGSITYRAWDQTSGAAGSKVDASTNGGTTAFSSSNDTASITITAVNDAPVLTPAAPTLAPINEDQTANAGQTVASFIGASITDVDAGAVQGIAVTGLSSGTGTWQFSTDGGGNWADIGAVSGSSALLLRSTDSVRFVPNGQNPTSGSITYRAWDQTSGSTGAKVDASTNGSATAFSASTDTASITVAAVNDAPVLSPAGPTLTAITEDQTANAGQTVASFVGTSIVDVDAGAVQGIAITGLTSGTGTWQFSTDAGGNWASVGAVSGTSALLLRSTDAVRFVPDGQNATSGSITYRAWDQTSGSTGSKVDASANGGTTAFSTASDTASITVTTANDAPVLTPVAPTLTAITEDQTANAGQTVTSVVGASIADGDAGALQGIAVTGLTSGTGAWQFSTDGGASWASVGAVSDGAALLLRASDSIRFAPSGENATTGSISYRAWDQTSGSAGSQVDTSSNGGTTAFSTATDTASITATAVNDAPLLTPGAPVLGTIAETATNNSGQTVASFIGASIADVDGGAVQGIAVTGIDAGNGSWQFSVDAGASWTTIGAVADSAALLLRATDAVRFVPDGSNGTTGSLTYRAWDQTAGSAGSLLDASTNGATTAFSSATDTATITVSSVNSAPVLSPAAPTLGALTEDQTAAAGQTVASFVGASIADVDAGAAQGIAVTAAAAGNGAWQYSLDGGSSWNALGAVSDATALLLRATDSLRFVPNGQNATAASISYRAWDQTSGSAGSVVDASLNGGATAFSAASDTASITVTAVNDAPTLAPIAPALATITEDETAHAGQTVASFVGASGSDVDSGAVSGIAITGQSSGSGTWQFSTDGGASWVALGAVNDAAALLLRSSDFVRFIPNAQNATNGTLTYRAWDQSAGSAGGTFDASVNGGTTAFSAATDSASLSVTAINDAPVLTPLAPTLSALTEDQTNPPGQTVAALIGSSIVDIDAGAVQGIAITALASGSGSWQFSLDGGGSWAAIGPVSDTSALLLRATDAVRFVPDGASATSGAVTYRAWDQTSGSAGNRVDASTAGGTTAFGTVSDTASVAVSAVNDAPVLAPIAPTLAAIDEDQLANAGQSVASFIGASITDVDSGAAPGIAITGLASGNGAWQFSTDAGASWSAVGVVSDGSALLLRSTDAVRFLPDGANATTAAITYRAWDQSSGSAGSRADARNPGNTTAFSAATDTASLSVTGANDAPVLTPLAPTLATLTEDQTSHAGQTVAAIVGASIADIDAGAASGIAVTGLVSGTGTWQFSTDAGAGWSAVGPVADGAALLLGPTDVIRFVPDGANATTGSLTWRAWDATTGSVGDRVDTGAAGGTTAFSSATDTASIGVTAVNDAPVLASGAPALTAITEDETAPGGQTVASFIGASITDVDSGAAPGIAITGLASGNGAWQFSVDGGGSWAGLGAVSEGAAWLLRATDLIRFVPDGSNGSTAALTYRAWDQTSGSAGTQVDASTGGGVSAFSAAHATATLAVAPVNDAPLIARTGSGPVAVDVDANATAVTTLTATDIDQPAQPLTWSIAGGADAARFAIDAASGALSFAAAPGVAGAGRRYDVVVQVSDGAQVDTLALAVNVAALDEPGPAQPEPAQPESAPAIPAPAPAPAAASQTGTAAARPAPSAEPVAPPAAAPRGGPALEIEPPGATSIGPASRIDLRVGTGARTGAATASQRVDLEALLAALGTAGRSFAPTVATDEHHGRFTVDTPASPADEPTAAGPLDSPTAITTGIALSLGIIGWASRGAALIASVLVSSPAWRSYDLLPVLQRRSEDADWGDDEPTDERIDATGLPLQGHADGTTRRDHDIQELQ